MVAVDFTACRFSRPYSLRPSAAGAIGAMGEHNTHVFRIAAAKSGGHDVHRSQSGSVGRDRSAVHKNQREAGRDGRMICTCYQGDVEIATTISLPDMLDSRSIGSRGRKQQSVSRPEPSKEDRPIRDIRVLIR